MSNLRLTLALLGLDLVLGLVLAELALSTLDRMLPALRFLA